MIKRKTAKQRDNTAFIRELDQQLKDCAVEQVVACAVLDKDSHEGLQKIALENDAGVELDVALGREAAHVGSTKRSQCRRGKGGSTTTGHGPEAHAAFHLSCTN
eukprot:1161729-Pelagomonas_calceolata.AAC.7